MNIGIIGAGRVGGGLGRIWSRKGHRILFSYSRTLSKLEDLAQECPDAAAGTPSEAVAQSEVLLLAVRWEQADDALAAAGPMEGKILIDCTNPLTPDLGGLAVGHTTSAAEEIAEKVPGARVVKAFNTAFADVYYAESRLLGSRMPTMLFCGDDGEAKSIVSRLIVESGFESVDAGPLRCARYLEPLAMLMIELGFNRGMGTGIALSLLHR